jgi:hypothetical protein
MGNRHTTNTTRSDEWGSVGKGCSLLNRLARFLAAYNKKAETNRAKELTAISLDRNSGQAT